MAIERDGVTATTIGALLEAKLRIPHYQRPYVWTAATALRLYHDISDAQQASCLNLGDQTPPYVLGAVILHRNDGELDIVDGQQRLLTLQMILRILRGEHPPANSDPTRTTPAAAVWRQLHDVIHALPPSDQESLTRFIRDSCTVVQVVTDDVDEAFRVFDSQNYRGKPLAPHDLLKAHHLREMRGESETLKAATVEQWESAGDRTLSELFSLYLYRISKWSRGESAPEFTTQEIETFKGISTTGVLSPSARYHMAAQSAIPIMSMWQESATAGDELNVQRSRFQLDAPQLSGRHFFEMVAFMDAEVERLKNLPFPSPTRIKQTTNWTFRDALSHSRYRKVTELYLAAMLYFVNKFSDADMDMASRHLFKWSFDLRVKHLRVVQASINNSGFGKEDAISPFPTFRNSADSRAVQNFNSSGEQYNDDHETELFNYLTGAK